MDWLLRFFLGGIIVSLFAVLGDVFKPKSFAGIFGAAPSVALASLALAASRQGMHYVSLEGRSMVLGAIAFIVYAALSSWLLMRKKWPALPATLLASGVWVALSLSLRAIVLR
jgi:hypothetical protein